jgi:hypothetical protein
MLARLCHLVGIGGINASHIPRRLPIWPLKRPTEKKDIGFSSQELPSSTKSRMKKIDTLCPGTQIRSHPNEVTEYGLWTGYAIF